MGQISTWKVFFIINSMGIEEEGKGQGQGDDLAQIFITSKIFN